MNRLKELRDERKLSTRAMEIKTGINYNSICRYENESRDFNTEVLRKLASFFQVSIDYLLCFSSHCIYAKYKEGNAVFRLAEQLYKELFADYIFFENDVRYIDINKMFNLPEGQNNMMLFEEFVRIDKMDSISSEDLKDTSTLIEELKDTPMDIELTKALINKIKSAIK